MPMLTECCQVVEWLETLISLPTLTLVKAPGTNDPHKFTVQAVCADFDRQSILRDWKSAIFCTYRSNTTELQSNFKYREKSV